MFSGLVAQGEITRLLDEVYGNPDQTRSCKEQEHFQESHRSARERVCQPCRVEITTRQEGGERRQITLLVAHRLWDESAQTGSSGAIQA